MPDEKRKHKVRVRMFVALDGGRTILSPKGKEPTIPTTAYLETLHRVFEAGSMRLKKPGLLKRNGG